MGKLTSIGITAVAACSAVALVPAPALPASVVSVHCGQALTHSVRLANDLVDCPGDGLVVGADWITIDLNGHTVDGDATPGGDTPDVGIHNVGHRGVTIERGIVREFDRGVRLENAITNRVRDLTVHSIAGRNIELRDSAENLVDHNTSSGSPRSAIALVSSNDNVVEHNTASGNHVGIFISDASGNRVDGNAMSDEESTGIETDGVERTTFVGNRIVHSGGAISLVGDDNLFVRNTIADIPQCPEGGCGFGISVEGGSRNVVDGNVVSDSGYIGIRVDAYVPPVTGTVLRDNVVRGAAVFAIAIDPDQVGPVDDTLVQGNVTLGSGDDGINVQSPSTTLAANRAMHNADLGIEAVSGVIDGGGNVAEANGNPLQCTNLLCR